MDRTRINNIVIKATGSTVQHGPFEGMRLINKFCWGDGDISTKLLGMYEQELHGALMEVSKERYGSIVDVGCAEGFYAIGLARFFKDITVHAFDLNNQALAVAKEAAAVNGVEGLVSFDNDCTQDRLIDIIESAGRSFIFCDCEGYELDLLCSPRTSVRLKSSDILVECHDFINGHITPGLFKYYLPTHKIDLIWAGGRNPNAFPILANLTDQEKWGLVNENRMCQQHWLFMRAKEL